MVPDLWRVKRYTSADSAQCLASRLKPRRQSSRTDFCSAGCTSVPASRRQPKVCCSAPPRTLCNKGRTLRHGFGAAYANKCRRPAGSASGGSARLAGRRAGRRAWQGLDALSCFALCLASGDVSTRPRSGRLRLAENVCSVEERRRNRIYDRHRNGSGSGQCFLQSDIIFIVLPRL